MPHLPALTALMTLLAPIAYAQITDERRIPGHGYCRTGKAGKTGLVRDFMLTVDFDTFAYGVDPLPDSFLPGQREYASLRKDEVIDLAESSTVEREYVQHCFPDANETALHQICYDTCMADPKCTCFSFWDGHNGGQTNFPACPNKCNTYNEPVGEEPYVQGSWHMDEGSLTKDRPTCLPADVPEDFIIDWSSRSASRFADCMYTSYTIPSRSRQPVCGAWCNQATCMDRGCDDCSALTCERHYCDAYCTRFTCDGAYHQQNCGGCAVCEPKAYPRDCKWWCNSLTSHLDSCAGCATINGQYCPGSDIRVLKDNRFGPQCNPARGHVEGTPCGTAGYLAGYIPDSTFKQITKQEEAGPIDAFCSFQMKAQAAQAPDAGTCVYCMSDLTPSLGYPSWCNSYTCLLSTCAASPVCGELEANSHCAAWCNPFTYFLQHCAGCAV